MEDGGGELSQDLKLRQKCGKATVSKSTGQLISGITDVPALVTVCVFTFFRVSVMQAFFVQHRLSRLVPEDCVAIKLMMAF